MNGCRFIALSGQVGEAEPIAEDHRECGEIEVDTHQQTAESRYPKDGCGDGPAHRGDKEHQHPRPEAVKQTDINRGPDDRGHGRDDRQRPKG